MAIKDFSGWPDDRVPECLRRRREDRRAAKRADDRKMCSCNLHFSRRTEVLDHCDATGHRPLVADDNDKFLKRNRKSPNATDV